jgi:N-dimethylarginine dimethylaminohydrolase
MIRESRIQVDFEYGTLKEVIVGIPYVLFPEITSAPWVSEAMTILPEDEARKMIALSGKDSVETGQYEPLEEENRELIRILREHKVTVHRPEQVTRERAAINFGEEFIRLGGISQQFTRDPILVIGDIVIENAMGSLYRRADILGLKNLFLERLMNSDARWVAMPSLDYSRMIREGHFDKTAFPVLEGGDVIVLGKNIFVGVSRNRTTGSSILGYRWLKAFLQPSGYDVELIPLPESILHLDVVLSVPRHGVIIVCPEAFPEGIPSYFRGWRQITVTMEQARRLAANGLPLDESHYILGYNDHFSGTDVQKALENEGITVYRIPFGNHNSLGGSIRCSTHPLVRVLSH